MISVGYYFFKNDFAKKEFKLPLKRALLTTLGVHRKLLVFSLSVFLFFGHIFKSKIFSKIEWFNSRLDPIFTYHFGLFNILLANGQM